VSDLAAIAESVVQRALPGEAVEAYVTQGVETEVRAFDGEVESLSSSTSAGIGIRVLLAAGGEGTGPTAVPGARVGFAWAGSLEAGVVGEVLEDARDNARFATPDPDVVLATPDGWEPAVLELWDDAAATIGTDVKIATALELERRTRHGDRRIRQVASADYADAAVEMALASTTGIRAAARRTSAFVSVSAIAGAGLEAQTGTGFSVGRSLGELDLEEASDDAVLRAVRMLGATKAPTARCTVVFEPRVVSTLLSVVAGALSGDAVVKGRSFFAGRLGEQVADPVVRIVDDPTDSRAYGASVFDGEGLACRRNVLIEDGTLRSFVHDTVSARRAGTSSTGSAVRGGFAGTPGAGCRAVVLSPGVRSADEIVAAVGEGLYVQSVTGIHSGVNPVSGDFSVGAEGLMIRDGALAEPVREVTVASTLQRMLRSVLHVGGDLRWLPGVAAGQTVAIGDMQLSGS